MAYGEGGQTKTAATASGRRCNANRSDAPVADRQMSPSRPGAVTRSDDPAAAPDDGDRPPDSDPMRAIIEQWAQIAASHARTEPVDGRVGVAATVAGIEGPWGYGVTAEQAVAELRSVLADWAAIKLEDGDRDIPDMEGVSLVTAAGAG